MTWLNNAWQWLSHHGGALTAFAGALGIFLHAVSPEVAAWSGGRALHLATAIAVLGAVLSAYGQGARDE